MLPPALMVFLKYQLSAPVNFNFAVGISLLHHSQRKTSQDLKMPICCEVTTFLSVFEGLIWECQNNFHKLTILGDFKKEFQCISKKTYTFRTVFRFSPKRKNSHLLFPAGTRKVVNLGHFFGGLVVPPSFVNLGPKLRVLP